MDYLSDSFEIMDVEELEGEKAQRQDGDESHDVFDPNLLKKLRKEVEQSFVECTNDRIKLLWHMASYFQQVAVEAQEVRALPKLMRVFHLIQGLIIDVSKLVTSLNTTMMPAFEVYDVVYKMGGYVESIFKSAYNRCETTGVVFGRLVEDLSFSLLTITRDSNYAWLYSCFVSRLVIFLINTFADAGYEEFVQDWCYQVQDLMISIGDAVIHCGDFEYQYYLLTVISYWATLVVPEVALVTLNKVFGSVVPSGSIRSQLMNRFDDTDDQIVHTFLNALNGPKDIRVWSKEDIREPEE